MSQLSQETPGELPLEALLLQCNTDRYKLAYSAIRWAKEIKHKENLPEPIPHLLPRALREILTGKVPITEVEKLPMMAKIVAPAPPPIPTITMATNTDEAKKMEAEAEAEAEEADKNVDNQDGKKTAEPA